MIVVVGLSHKTAPIDVRERLALGRDGLPAFLRALHEHPSVSEAMVISTCNRVEVVAAGAGGAALESACHACVEQLERHAADIGRHLYRRQGGDAVRHLFRVASSLDSMVLGEPQILGQVKDAYEVARGAGTLGPILHRTVPRAIRTAKRVRSETAIGSGQVSVPSVAVELTRQIFGDMRKRCVLLIGSGEMAEAVARLLRGAGARLLVLGRTLERVEELARAVDGEPRLFRDLRATLVEADVIISSTSAPGYVVDADMVKKARRSRRGREQSYIDLAVPRDIDPSVNELDGVFLYNIDDFEKLVANTLSTRGREAEQAQRIVDEETRGYERWADAQQATPTIVQLRAKLRHALRSELERSLRGRLKHLGPDERAALLRMIEAAENRLLHGPTMRLRQAAERASSGLSLEELSMAIAELFELDRGADELSAPDEVSAELASLGSTATASSPANDKIHGEARDAEERAGVGPGASARPGASSDPPGHGVR
jgi:glutamyl-tRNA reductase